MMLSDISVCSWNSPTPLAGNIWLYLSRSVSAKQSGWLQSLWTDAGTCVHCTNTCPRYRRCGQQLEAAPHWHMGKHITKRHHRSSWSMEKAVMCKHEAKWHHFEHLLNQNRHFYRSYLKADKVSKSEGTMKVKYAYHFWNCADAVDRKLSKLVHACRSYSLPILAHFFETVYIFLVQK